MEKWQDISTYLEGSYVLFWLPVGEKGVPALEAAMAFRSEMPNGDLHPWSNGWPNSGYDYDFTSQPTHWMKCPLGPNDEQVWLGA
jgi:hypothetical protein